MTSRVKNILVVDDTPANLDLLAAMLTDRQYKVRLVPNGRLALKAAAQEPPDLILLDVSMPEMDGYQVCERLRADATLRGVPVIFLSARTDTDAVVRGFEAGGVDYVTKPFHAEELEARISTHLELRRLQSELEQSYARLRELETLRDDLTHMIVHDMRSPLGVISLALQLVGRSLADQLDAKSRKHLRLATESSQRLSTMVDDMLDVSRLESGQIPLQLENADLRETLDRAVSALGPALLDRSVELSGPALLIPHDRALIGRILTNIVVNALRFTGSGGKVLVGLDGEEGRARVRVRDHGPGIPPELRAKVFEKFWRAAERHEASVASTGLGLTFCKLAVEAHGGTIGVDSTLGEGSTFWFTLPLARPGA